MKLAIGLTLVTLLLTACYSIQPDLPQHTDVPISSHSQLERKAATGDAAAAWQLHCHYSRNGQEQTAELWLRRAAELDLAEAQRTLAFHIKDYGFSYQGFGATAPAAVENLLERSARKSSMACHELASAYEEGYFSAPDCINARIYFLRGAKLGYQSCWPKISYYYRNGLGGPRDDAAAYYWISLACSCIAPGSITGKEVWKSREEMATNLPIPVIEAELRKIDNYISDIEADKITIYPTRFLAGYIYAKDEDAARSVFCSLEEAHRRKYKKTN